ncbi:MAG: FkbM family methyltransferase [Acidobacteriaceae bacterium]
MLSTVKRSLRKALPPSFYRSYRRAVERLTRRSRPLIRGFDEHPSTVLKCCVAYNTYGTYCVPLSSMIRAAAQTVLAGKVWEPETIKVITANCAGGDIVHAGTYFGDFLPALSRAVDDGRRVWAFEPNPENYRCADITIRINGLRNVELRNAGLADETRQFQMATKDQHGIALGGLSTISTQAQDARDATPVDVVSIDEAVPSDRNISVLQLDVEGFELRALRGAIGTIRRCRPLLVIEMFPSDPWIAENILGMGYVLSGKVYSNSILSPPRR